MADRYAIHDQLGSGGMAEVYRATDLSTGRTVALKRLTPPDRPAEIGSAAAQFEREFHTLAQLSHPRVISVFDYGVDGSGTPFYTMELLDGGDLRDRAPLPWPRACSLIFDVCSSLALLHSRRLLHRDVSPRNIRCTQDGRAKLIDFGAMAPMSAGGARIVGTPAYTAPETVHRSALDARTDLFSLGATLYYVLSGEMPYPARSFAEALEAWEFEPMPPSTYAPGIPAALDDLVLSMVRIEPSLRPASAFDVMQTLAAVAQLGIDEADAVSRAYLVTPTLVGRDDVLASLRDRLKKTSEGRGCGLIVHAESGLGRSRMLDACALEAKTLGATVLRANATGEQRDFALALDLIQDLLDAQPMQPLDEQFPELFERDQRTSRAPDEAERAGRVRLKSSAALQDNANRLQSVICRFMLHASQARPLCVAVDDVQRIDGPSAAVLAALVDRSVTSPLMVILTAESISAGHSQVMDVLGPRCESASLKPLTASDTRRLLASLFGDVAHLDMLSAEIYAVALGNPQQSMAVAEHLVANQTIRYAAGRWTLPSRLQASDLPRSAEATIRTQMEGLSPLARFLVQAQAAAFFEVWSDADYRALVPDQPARAVGAAVSELLATQAIVTPDGHNHTLRNRIWAATLRAEVEPKHHRALAELYRERANSALVHHLFEAGLEVEALAALSERHSQISARTDHRGTLEENFDKFAIHYPHAIDCALRLGRSPREVADLRRWCVAVSVGADASYYWRAAPGWLQQLERDSGLDLWRADTRDVTPQERLSNALQGAQERYLASPERERVYRVDEALAMLAEYVACSIAIGMRALDYELLVSLPPILEPFAPLSPLLEAIWQNAQATVDGPCHGRFLRARASWLQVHAKLEPLKTSEVGHVDSIQNAIVYGLGMIEASLGLASAADRVAVLADDPLLRVNALRVRSVVRLEQGDWPEAKRLSRHAEELALRWRVTQMFASHIVIEISAYTRARDLEGLEYCIGRVAAQAARYPGWEPYLLDARARFELVRGDFAAAKAGFERAIALIGPIDPGRRKGLPCWVTAHGCLAESLLHLGRHAEARATAVAALEVCARTEVVSISDGLVRVLALAEAKLGDLAAACAHIEGLIEQQTELGITGLKLGLSYEARALIALWCADEPTFEHYARLTAREYRHGARCPLGARYEALINEARRCGIEPSVQVQTLEPPAVAEDPVDAGDGRQGGA